MTEYTDNFDTKKKYKKTYIDKGAFHIALVEWKKQLEINPDYRMSEFIGECLLKLVNHAGTRRNFSGYHYLDQMKTEALYLCVRYAKNYNPNYIIWGCPDCKTKNIVTPNQDNYVCKQCGKEFYLSNLKIVTCDPFNYFSKYIENAFKLVINKEKALAETKFNYIKNEFCNHPDYDFRIEDGEEQNVDC
jgi:hypothetical protein